MPADLDALDMMLGASGDEPASAPHWLPAGDRVTLAFVLGWMAEERPGVPRMGANLLRCADTHRTLARGVGALEGLPSTMVGLVSVRNMRAVLRWASCLPERGALRRAVWGGLEAVARQDPSFARRHPSFAHFERRPAEALAVSEVALRLGCSRSKVRALLPTVEASPGSRGRVVRFVPTAAVEDVETQLRSLVDKRALAARLGCDPRFVDLLQRHGVLAPATGLAAAVVGGVAWSVLDALELVRRLEASAEARPGPSSVLREAFRTLRRSGCSESDAVAALLRGGLKPCGVSLRSQGLARILFNRAQVLALARPRESVTLLEAAARLGVGRREIYRMAAEGLLPTEPAPRGVRGVRVPVGALPGR